MVRSLWKLFFHTLCYPPPFAKGDVYFLWIFAFLHCDFAQERDKMVSHIILNSCAVPNCVHIANRYPNEAKVCVGFQGMNIILVLEFLRQRTAKFILRCFGR